ncbi:DUF1127 domain-containing protein [Mesobacterium pallidum]|uniref:DUF1127 domain-containing protein n=1 Tax=Mesobacterium pallidum TaxID=2872037 RepID=UPI001EE1FE20|nr:DUF1127 domain-containing protein [Mesobacterium pallidum]
MALAVNNTADSGFAANLLARFGAYLMEASDRAARRQVYRQTYNELAALSQRDLADLGISRGQIGSISYEAAYGK